MSKTAALIGALDTKGEEFAFVKAEIERRGHRVLVINVGVMGEPAWEGTAAPEVSATTVAGAGGSSLARLREEADRGARHRSDDRRHRTCGRRPVCGR